MGKGPIDPKITSLCEKKSKNKNMCFFLMFQGSFNPKQAQHRAAAVPAQKSRGNSVLGIVFSHTMPEMDFHSHRFS